MLEKLNRVASSRGYWLLLILLGVAQLTIALLYQYVWDEPPCVVCIHTRLLVTASILLATVAAIVPRQRILLAAFHALNAVIMAGLFERAWFLLGTERGTLIASCDFELGMPAWLAFDKWFPALFEVRAACGYTPELLFGITMAEALIVLSATLAVLGATLMAVLLLKRD
jgi:disulfide bond formation protein DsbB